MKLKHILLVLVLFFAGYLRLFNIQTLPPSLFSDEVDIAYQAKTFAQNQTDYFGNRFPFHFHSFSDWQPGAGIYASSFVYSLTHNPEISVRLPSAVFGIIAVYILYLITGSLIPSVLLAISPWAIHYSRTGFAVSGMLLFILLGIYFWQRYLSSKKSVFIYVSAICFAVTPYFYSTANLFLPITGLIMFVIWRQEIIKNFRSFILPIIFVLLLLTPFAVDTFTGKAGFRFSYISIFTQPHREQITDSFRYQDTLIAHSGEVGVKTSLSSYIFHNKYQLVWQRFISNYFSSFSTNFLFITGDQNPRHGFGGQGLLYTVEFFFVLLGIFSSFYHPQKNKISQLFLVLLLTAPIPYALTRDVDSPHATRLILMLPSLIYFASQGIYYLISLSKAKIPRIFVVSSLIIVYLVSFLSFWHFYNYDYPNLSADVWHTGMKQAVQATNLFPDTPIIFSNSFEPFLPFFLLFHPYNLPSGTSIASHLTSTNDSSFSGQVLDHRYFFGTINWNNLSSLPADAILVVPQTEYEGNHLQKFTQIGLISKKYFNQQQFYLLTTNVKK